MSIDQPIAGGACKTAGDDLISLILNAVYFMPRRLGTRQIMRMILAAALCIFGCGGETSKRETAVPAPNPIESFEDARKERIEAIRKDRAGLVREAVNHVRR